MGAGGFPLTQSSVNGEQVLPWQAAKKYMQMFEPPSCRADSSAARFSSSLLDGTL